MPDKEFEKSLPIERAKVSSILVVSSSPLNVETESLVFSPIGNQTLLGQFSLGLEEDFDPCSLMTVFSLAYTAVDPFFFSLAAFRR